MFRKGTGDWTQYRQLPGSVEEVDFHRSEDRRFDDRGLPTPYDERMAQVYDDALEALKRGYERGVQWVLFRHGCT
jgi:hypothetical protein